MTNGSVSGRPKKHADPNIGKNNLFNYSAFSRTGFHKTEQAFQITGDPDPAFFRPNRIGTVMGRTNIVLFNLLFDLDLR
jgi:hypothetical protein